jgi:hypothetical protein
MHLQGLWGKLLRDIFFARLLEKFDAPAIFRLFIFGYMQ